MRQPTSNAGESATCVGVNTDEKKGEARGEGRGDSPRPTPSGAGASSPPERRRVNAVERRGWGWGDAAPSVAGGTGRDAGCTSGGGPTQNSTQRTGRRIGTLMAVTRICGTRRGSAAATRAPAT